MAGKSVKSAFGVQEAILSMRSQMGHHPLKAEVVGAVEVVEVVEVA